MYVNLSCVTTDVYMCVMLFFCQLIRFNRYNIYRDPIHSMTNGAMCIQLMNTFFIYIENGKPRHKNPRKNENKFHIKKRDGYIKYKNIAHVSRVLAPWQRKPTFFFLLHWHNYSNNRMNNKSLGNCCLIFPLCMLMKVQTVHQQWLCNV